MKVLITGASGQLGQALRATVPAHCELLALDSRMLDISQPEAVQEAVTSFQPDLLINAAAYTAVDKAESEPARAHAVNAEGAANLAAAAQASGTRLIHISTDFVFDGSKSSPYQPQDRPNPLGAYGASKWEGEQQVLDITQHQALIIRTAWVYAAQGSNFVKTMLRLMAEREQLGVVSDQIGTPTSVRTLAQAIWQVAARPNLCGIYHWTDAGAASWYDFALAIQEEALVLGLLAKAIPIRPICTQDYPTPARRPAYSVLDKSQSWVDFDLPPIHWRVALRQVLQELKEHGNA